VTVDPLTVQVLREALLLSGCSGGLFDPTVADGLVATGFLPDMGGDCVGRRSGTWRDIEVGDDGRVRFHRPLLIDLGGIAKGFAVDQAVTALIGGGAICGIVNAGGDLRVFGGIEQVIHLRDPRSPTQAATTITLCDRAVATSAPYFALRRHAGRRVSPLIDPRTGMSCTRTVSVTVEAATCLHADALTKVVLADPVLAATVLPAYDATATVLGDEGAASQARQPVLVLQA
jgi:thiamine biosynthesis lipoprotein